ncbi:PAQR family membrane homeostasis protein TrhA [Ruania albidiflava]|uniref:PAQR family membrane homeostasis protein TrhA n=1 Tax=Ruania albidiflava TaxID=366586 RepID=UPI0003B4D6F9|nr:hemolysin III family protein [Ruania albidiflava]
MPNPRPHTAVASADAVDEAVAQTPPKPRLRGWIHAVMAPLSLMVALVLVIGAPTLTGKVTTAIFGAATIILFGTSAVYHRGTWSPQATAVLRRLDHSNIFLVIAGTYTPLAALLLPEGTARLLLWLVWGGAVLGLLARVFWLSAPRWLYVPIYIALGWVAVGFLPAFWSSGGPAIALLVIIGGLGYTLGAVAYGVKRPNPVPGWFGFHEIFHTGTVIGYGCHAAAIYLAAFST